MDAPPGGDDAVTRAGMAALIARHFDWVHSSEYLDPYKAPQPTYRDVAVGRTRYAKEVETALEERVLDGADGVFHPDRPVSPEDAALWLARAFLSPSSDGRPTLDAAGLATLAAAGGPGVQALRDAGLLAPAAGRRHGASARVSRRQAEDALRRLAAAVVAPAQVMCKPGTTAPRRYITITTPTAGATIRYEFTFDGSEPADPTAASPTFDLRRNGVLQFVNPLGSAVDSRFYRLKTVALKDGLQTSAPREFSWTILRPRTGAFRATQIHEPTATSPAVWKINNPAEYYQANVYYLEGSERGVLVDAGEYSYERANLKTFVDSLASKPYDVVVGHAHPDHAEQIYNFTSAGVTLYASAIEKAALIASTRPDWQAAGRAAVAASDGHQLDLGNVQVSLFHAPGHTNGLMTVLVNQTGWVYCSDHFGCNRPYTADTTQYNGVKADLFLSLQQQLLAGYRARCGEVTAVTNAHQDAAVTMACVDNFVGCFQRLIDDGDVTEPSIRGGIVGNPTGPVKNSRMSKIGDMWRDRDWMAIANPLGSGWDQPVDYLSAPTDAFPSGVAIDYNAPGVHRRYSVLSNVEFVGGTLVGVDVYWAAPANGVANKIPNKFDPWTYAYAVTVPRGVRRLTIKPTAMSNRISAMRVNGVALRQGASRSLRVRPGQRITVDVVAADRRTRSTYAFTVQN